MRIHRRLIGTLAAALLAAPAAAAPQRPQSPGPAIDALFERWAGPDTPGCAVGVAQAGKTVIERAYGSADLEHAVPNTARTLFEAGSVAKQFTAAAILLLAEDGRLRLADDVRRFVPELPDYGETVTIDHLINHSSGLRDWGDLAAIAGWPRGTRAHTPADVLDIIRRQRSLNYPPGTEYSYTNSGYNMMALIVERVSGRTLAQFTRERLFVPLGMAATQWRDDFRRVVKDRAVAYDRRGDDYVQGMPFEDAYGNGGLITTVGDLLRWNEMLSGGRLGGFVTGHLQRRSVLRDGTEITYARGLFVQTYRGFTEVAHGGATGAYRSWLGRYPERRLSIAILCNAGDANPTSLARGIADRMLGAREAKAAAMPPGPEAAGLAGTYVNQRTGFPMRLALEGGAIRIVGGAVLEPIGGGRFRFDGGKLAFDRTGSFRLHGLDGQIVSFRRAAAAGAPADLARFAGLYSSDEAGASYAVSIEQGALVLRLDRRPEAIHRLAHAYGDTFEFEGGIVRFYRRPGRRPDALGIGTGRIRDLRFERVR